MKPYCATGVVGIDKDLSKMYIPDDIMIENVRTGPIFKNLNVVISGIGSKEIIVVVILFCYTSKPIKDLSWYPPLEGVSLKILEFRATRHSLGVVEVDVVVIHVLVFSFDDHVQRNMVTDGGRGHTPFILIQSTDSLHGVKKVLGDKAWGFARAKNDSRPNHHESSKTTRSLAPRK